jgi:hypothetical protein
MVDHIVSTKYITERFVMAVEIGNVGLETSFEIVSNSVLLPTSLIYGCEGDTASEVGSLSEVFFDITEIKHDILKYLCIWPELDFGTIDMFCGSDFFNRCNWFTSLIRLEIFKSVFPDSCFGTRRECIDD